MWPALLFLLQGVAGSWEEWWTYDGISGPDFWGLLNPEWSFCTKGRRQSPIDLDPAVLLYDPHLKSLHVDKYRVSGTIMNTGHSIIFRSESLDPETVVNITEGPLSYKYRFEEIHLHYGRTDDTGSEHTLSGYSFPAEIFGYNSDLYNNISEALAVRRSEGVVGIAVLLQMGDLSNAELRILTSQLHRIVYRGQEAHLQHLSVRDLLPDTHFFMTYEGSLTMPGCQETVTWIVMNRPIYITKQQLYILRKLMQGAENSPKAPLGNNFRPPLPLNQRVVRTNIDFRRTEAETAVNDCLNTMSVFSYYNECVSPEACPRVRNVQRCTAACTTKNSSTSWDVETPLISQCFQNLVLVLGSCGVLWIVAPFEFIKICKTRGTPTQWTKLSIAKITLKVILLIVCSVDLSKAVYAYINYPDYGFDGLIAPMAYFFTIVLTIIITLMCRNRGMRVSLALPSFWMISTITTLIYIYNDIQNFQQDDWVTVTSLVDNSLSFLISIIQLILSNIADKPASSRSRELKDLCPLEGVSLPSRLTFSWIVRLLIKSIQNSLHQDYLIPMCFELRSSIVSKRFREMTSLLGQREQSSSFASTENLTDETIGFPTEARSETVYSNTYLNGKSLSAILLRISRKFLIIASILEIVYTLLYFLPAYILSLLLDNSSQEWHNYLYALALFIALLFSSFADSQRKYYGLMGALRIKTAVMNAVFEKALKVTQQSKNIKKLLTTDSENVFIMICILSEVWGTSIRLIAGVYIFWCFLGTACFVGIASAMILIPTNVIVEHGANYFQNKALEKRKERMSLLQECLRGMKTLKFYAWEEIFLEKLMSFRKSEMAELRKAGFLRMAFKFIFFSGTSLVMLVSLSALILIGNSIDVKTIFVSFLLIFLLKSPFRSILHLLAHFVQGLASISHIQRFLETKELLNLSPEETMDGNSVLLTNASFIWEGMDIPCLKNLNLRIPKGSLIAVVGETKSGKSSLLRALLGELQKLDEGAASVEGQLAFVGDEAWIQNTTLEKNVLFLKPKDEKFYRKTLEACALYEDIDTLPAGEETEIGQMGVHLSLDQMLKVDLARAVYQNADVYLLDDPLRYLESSLSEHLYHRVIGRSGLLKGKTRIITTTKEEFLPLVDFILFLKDGRILEQGTYSQLKDKNGNFAEYLETAQCTNSATKVSRHSWNEKQDLGNTYTFEKPGDLWYSTAVALSKVELKYFETNETIVSTKGLGYKLADFLKTIGFVLATLSILVAGLACSCEAASGVWLSEWTDGNGEGQKPSHNLLIYSGFIFSQVILTIFCGLSFFATTTAAAEKLHTWLLIRVIRASQTTYERTPYKTIIQSFDTDFQYVDEKIPDIFYVWIMATLRAPALLVVIFVVSPFVAVFSIPLLFAFLVIQKLYFNAWQQLQNLTAATSCPLSNLLDDSLRGASNIRATRSSLHFIQRFQLKLDTHNNCSLLYLLVSRWLSSSVDIMSAFLVLWITVMAFYERDKGDGFIGLAIVYSMQIAETLTSVVYMSSMLNNDLTAFNRLKSLSQIKQESEWEDPANSPPSSWPESGLISIQNLCTAYGEGMYPVLHNVSLTIQPGEKVAIVGKEESGISTLLYSLFRLIEPLEGQILIDNIDIRKLGLRDLRSRLAIIPQDTLVFKGTVRQNLDPSHVHNDEELWTALELSNLKNSFSSLDAPVEENMSIKEKRLLSVARCRLKKPKIVIIDELETPDSIGRQLFPDSTVLLFYNHLLPGFNGRIVRLLGGEVINEEFSTSSQQSYD